MEFLMLALYFGFPLIASLIKLVLCLKDPEGDSGFFEIVGYGMGGSFLFTALILLLDRSARIEWGPFALVLQNLVGLAVSIVVGLIFVFKRSRL